jgi:hypothetical protein
LRPARRSSNAPATPAERPGRFIPAFVAQVIGQFEPDSADTASAARAYARADTLGCRLPAVEVASL